MNFKECMVNGCRCWNCGRYRIVKQKGKEVFNAYKAITPKPGKPVSGYVSVVKEVVRVEKYIDEEIGEQKQSNVMGPKDYHTLEDAVADCK